ncbi:hypothetical protein ACFSC3_08320 [Sphingomonas floccifaciens]|uniref:Uncharacterized protein n=1 Tax=Sphingomonas floccifaciens TaxID=1844115 RepID=A0ABW4NDD1_9SPHN
MELIRLPIGEPAQADVDCIAIEEQVDHRFRLTASALCNDTQDAESVSIVGGPTFLSAHEAEAAGIAWATTVGVDRLFISSGTLARPLARLDIDGPL